MTVLGILVRMFNILQLLCIFFHHRFKQLLVFLVTFLVWVKFSVVKLIIIFCEDYKNYSNCLLLLVGEKFQGVLTLENSFLLSDDKFLYQSVSIIFQCMDILNVLLPASKQSIQENKFIALSVSLMNFIKGMMKFCHIG